MYSLPCELDTLGVIHKAEPRLKFPPWVDFRSAPGRRPSCEVGVAHCLAAKAIVGRSAAPFELDRLMRSCPVSGVGHAPGETEPPGPPMAGTHIGR